MALKVYKPGQANVSRWLSVASLLGLSLFGCYSLYHQFRGDILKPVATGVMGSELEFMMSPAFFICAALFIGSGGLAYWLFNYDKYADFLIETEVEVQKVSWARRSEVLSSSLVVIVTVFVLGSYISGIDALFGWLRKLVQGGGA